MKVIVNRTYPRFHTLKWGHNARLPASAADEPDRILFCSSPEEIVQALHKVIATVCGPRCDPVATATRTSSATNPHGALLAVLLPHHSRQRCAMRFIVGAGGHISGDGYGFLSHLYGLTSDWITSVDMLTVDGKGTLLVEKTDRFESRFS